VYQLLIYDVVEDYVQRRVPFRDAHLALARAAHERGELLLAGSFGDPVDGALLLFRAPDTSIPEAFARDDPYVRSGIVTGWRVRKWNEVLAQG
jgi:uncharacterized protein YciI